MRSVRTLHWHIDGWWPGLRLSGYFTVSNSSESETPNARASRNRFLKDGFRRAVSIPPKYVRCIWANSARRSWDSPRSPRSFRMCAASSFTAFCSAVNPDALTKILGGEVEYTEDALRVLNPIAAIRSSGAGATLGHTTTGWDADAPGWSGGIPRTSRGSIS